MSYCARSAAVHQVDQSAGRYKRYGHNVPSKAEVDAVMEQTKNAGAVIVKSAQETFWGGYAGCFQDPDQHLWEVVWNPHWKIQ
jgi:uncharacterized glyoxalase superfamily protein PhnB